MEAVLLGRCTHGRGGRECGGCEACGYSGGADVSTTPYPIARRRAAATAAVAFSAFDTASASCRAALAAASAIA